MGRARKSNNRSKDNIYSDYKREKRRKSRYRNTVMAFLITLIAVILAGSGVILVIKGLAANNSESNVDTFVKVEEESGQTESGIQIYKNDESENGEDDQTTINEEDSSDENTDANDSSTDSASISNGESSSSDESDSGEVENTASEDALNYVSSEDTWNRNVTSSNAEYTTVTFAGDILFDPGYAIMNKISNNGGAISGIIGDSLLNIMNSSDIMMINNEFPYSTRGTATEGKTYTFRADPSSASLLLDMGVDIVSFANNHAYDYGPDAIVDSVSTMDENGIAHVGAGSNIDEASHPVTYTTSSGQKIVIIGTTQVEQLDNPDTKAATETTPGVFRCLDDTLLLQEIRDAKSEGAFVIVFIHWGKELYEDIDWWQEKQGPEIAEAGADLIIGCHPHILQKIDYIGDTPVVYSLGNFLFNSKTLDSCLVQAEITGSDTCNLRFIPALQSGCTVNEATGSDATRIMEHMRSISTNVYIDTNGYISKK